MSSYASLRSPSVHGGRRLLPARNHLLCKFEEDDLACLVPHLKCVGFEADRVLENAGRSIDQVYFPEDGVLSVKAHSPGLGAIEVAMIGVEGATGTALAMGATRSQLETRVQVAGEGHCIAATVLADLLEQRPQLRMVMLTYAGLLTNQFTQTAVVAGRATIEVRLARHLLMTADRLQDPDMPLTHQALATALGVRRPGVTTALHCLEGMHLIWAKRLSITIRDRNGLEAVAGGSYGMLEREYARLCNPPMNEA